MIIYIFGCATFLCGVAIQQYAWLRVGEDGCAAGRAHSFMKMDLSQIEKISKALGDHTRLRIFQAIASGKETNCGDLSALRGVTHATVSHHLKVLSEAGLIECRREGQFVYNRAIPETLEEYARALGRIARSRKKSRLR